MFPRNITLKIIEALADTPVVMLNGARQTGKSTLAESLISKSHIERYVTLDDATVLAAAKHDPVGFISGLGGSTVT